MPVNAKVEIRGYGGAEPLVTESPELVGFASIDQLVRLLDGEPPSVVFGSSDIALPGDFDPQRQGSGELIGIMINDAPKNAPRRVTRMFVTEWPLSWQMVPGVF